MSLFAGWHDVGLAVRRETHFDDRVVTCFVERPETFTAMLEDAVRRRAAAEALVADGARLSWAELERRSSCLARGLLARGILHGDRIGLLLGNHVEFVLMLFAAGLIYATAFDANLNDETKAFSQRFLKRAGKTPNMNMVGSYSAVLHYLRAVHAAGGKDTAMVMAKMRDMPVKDVFTQDGHLRADGRMSHSMYVVQVKSPAESTNEWDLSKVIATVPAAVAVRPLDAGGCALVKGLRAG